MTERILRNRWSAGVFLVLACAVYWRAVLVGGQVLLPAGMLGGFAPFGTNPNAPWHILYWDALAQYYPWRCFAANQLHHGLLPLWNPYEFAGTPLQANGQSAVFYLPNIIFWLMDPARAFGLSAFFHTLLAAGGTYLLLRGWRLNKIPALAAALGFAWGGYQAAWIMLPTLADTAAWLPLLLWLLERLVTRPQTRLVAVLAVTLSQAFLAGHPQIFLYILLALLLRLCFLRPSFKALLAAAGSLMLSGTLCAVQILPTLELARLGHRAGQAGATTAGWEFLRQRALQVTDLPSTIFSNWPQTWGSSNENFAYCGTGVLLCAVLSLAATRRIEIKRQNLFFSLLLAILGLAVAGATPAGALLYYGVPGMAQMGGVGRALVWWSLGTALCCGWGLQWICLKTEQRLVPVVALAVIMVELMIAGPNFWQTSASPQVYPKVPVLERLKTRLHPGERVLFLTPHSTWFPAELMTANGGPNHPMGVLPPNGATVYGIPEVNGYDSLSSKAYREFLQRFSSKQISPPFNANMVLLSDLKSAALDALGVRYVVSARKLPQLRQVDTGEGCLVYERVLHRSMRLDGSNFYPGWRDGVYQPTSFRLGLFISLWGLTAAVYLWRLRSPRLILQGNDVDADSTNYSAGG